MLQLLVACKLVIFNHDTYMYETKKSIFLVNIRPLYGDLETGGGGGNDAVNIDFSSLENSICDLKRNIVDVFKTYFYQRKRNELRYSRRKCV